MGVNMKYLHVFAVLFILGLVLHVQAGSDSKKLKSKTVLLEYMYDECLATCEEVIKDQGACPLFCDFVNHLYNHDPTIWETITNVYRQDEEVIRWALLDVAQWKMKTKMEDLHETSMAFRDSLIKWGEVKRQREN